MYMWAPCVLLACLFVSWDGGLIIRFLSPTFCLFASVLYTYMYTFNVFVMVDDELLLYVQEVLVVYPVDPTSPVLPVQGLDLSRALRWTFLRKICFKLNHITTIDKSLVGAGYMYIVGPHCTCIYRYVHVHVCGWCCLATKVAYCGLWDVCG